MPADNRERSLSRRNSARGRRKNGTDVSPPSATAVRQSTVGDTVSAAAASLRPEGRVGVVDIGSNTVRLVVYETPTRLPIPIFNEKAECRLAEGLGRTGRLSMPGVTRAVSAIRRFVRLAQAMGVDRLELVATAAVRDAADGPAFVAAVEESCGHGVHVLSGAEEARLAAVGVVNSIPMADGVVADLGGGSLDLVGLDHGRVGKFATLPCGHLRLAEDSGGDRLTGRSLLNERLASVSWLGDMNGRTIYAVGGSWRALAKVFIDQTLHPLHVVDNFTIGFFEALRLSNLIAGLSPSTLERLPGVDAERRNTLPFAAAALASLIEAAKPRDVTFSAYGMREGQMLELLPPAVRRQDPLISACESRSERSGRFAVHGTEIFDWMTPLFANEQPEQHRLRLAICHLSDIGWNEHPDYRAEHAFYRILRLPFPGLSHSDRAEMAVAVLVRYGGLDDSPVVTPLLALLDERRLFRARLIGLALRLAHTLSGGAPGLLPQTRMRIADKDLALQLPVDKDVFLSEAVERRLERLAGALALKPVIAPARG